MAQNYRNQNESGRWQDPSRASQRGGPGRERYESGDERRYRPEWEERFHESGSQDDNSFEGDRSYSAGGYPEEFGYRRDNYRDSYAERERNTQQRHGGQEGRDEQRFGGSYYDRPFGRQGRSNEYGARGFQGGSMRSQGVRHDVNREDSDRGEDFNRGRNEQQGSGFFGGGSSNYYGSQGGFGWQGSQGGFGSGAGSQSGGYGTSGSMYGRGSHGHERQGGEFDRQSQQQSFRGRGPKGYERSDERLREMVCERLTDDPSIDAGEVSVEVTGKVVKLTGTVDDRRTKYLIEDVIEQVGGVRDIDNQLRVQSSGQTQAGQTSGSQFGTSDNTSASRSINVGQPGQSGNLGQSSTSTPTPSKRN